jgi:squalene-hopene/tetraprenyl-beta-curcumene cyclase
MTAEGKVREALSAALAHLLPQRSLDGFWRGELSSSALSTAVAAVALHHVDATAHRQKVTGALHWLSSHANADGGWGDTPDSPSNLSTTLLSWSALALAAPGTAAANAERWIEGKAGGLAPDALAAAVLSTYGNDRTFSAPILTVCALTGRLGKEPWRFVPQLPFELAVLPHQAFRFLRLSVVSYAIPALIAIGLVRHRNPPRNPRLKPLRDACVAPALRVLSRCQPSHGGFLEAAPLTAFVAASLAAAELPNHEVALRCARFLSDTVRADGSWPIDTNLSTWLTTLSINAMTAPGRSDMPLTAPERAGLLKRLSGLQTREVHPFTHAAPGGWAWTPLPGGVPDADDTAGALLALHNLGGDDGAARAAAAAGLNWLLGLQNSDGGIPTFCRGWGKLPFDQSCPDVTAHAIRAFEVWRDRVDPRMRGRLDSATARAVDYLRAVQADDGSWTPLWFGNQHTAGQRNPTYGTAQVVLALAALARTRLPALRAPLDRATTWLLSAQHAGGGWGGSAGARPSIEETALAVTALCCSGGGEDAARRGVDWIITRTAGGTRFEASPIGLYFSSLWYSEQLYPVIFTVQALSAYSRVADARAVRDTR